MRKTDPCDGHRSLSRELLVSLDLAVSHTFSHRLLDLALRADPQGLEEFSDAAIERILVHGSVTNLHTSLKFDGELAPTAAFYRLRHVQSKAGPVPDPLLPMESAGLSVPAADEHIDKQQWGSLICEVYVPHELLFGNHEATLTLTSEKGELKIPVKLTVWSFVLPDHLSFLPEMNCYGLPANERDYYRLAHENRTVLNAVPYSQNGTVNDGCAPRWDAAGPRNMSRPLCDRDRAPRLSSVD